MTVKSIPDHLKPGYAMDYVLKLKTINDLVEETDRSRRTVIRMLQEQGVYQPMPRIRTCMPMAVSPTVPEYPEEDPFAGLTVEEIYANLAPSAPIPCGMFDEEHVLQPPFFVFKNEPESKPENKAPFMGLINRVKRVFAAVLA